MTPVIRIRSIALQLLVMVIAGGMIVRLGYLQLVQHDFFYEKAQNQLKKIVLLTPHRGIIFDRNRSPLAMPLPAWSVYAVPIQTASENSRIVTTLGSVLSISSDTLKKKLNSQTHFVWIKRKITDSQYSALKAAQLPGVEFIKEERRIYPNGSLGCHILGFVGIDNQGLSGIEFYRNTFLSGASGKLILEGDPMGHQIISGARHLDPSQNGGNVILTIDKTIQYITQRHLKAAVESTGAMDGHAVVMNPQTGEILAMANYPDFDPNYWTKSSEYSRRNRLICDLYEPGSVFKIMTISAAIDAGIVTPGTILRVPETLTIQTRTIREAHGREPGMTDYVPAADIIRRSLNVGTTILSQRMKKDYFYGKIREYGFGYRLGIELPGEASGIIRKKSDITPLDLAMMSFGQGISVTPLQIAAATAQVANGGKRVRPHVIARLENAANTVVKATAIDPLSITMRPTTARDVTGILESVVESGTGETAKIPGHRIAGKTGTAQKAVNGGGYIPGAYMASFVGYFPKHRPTYLVLVILDTPRTTIWGSTAAAPVFRAIAADIIRIRNIVPDGYKSID